MRLRTTCNSVVAILTLEVTGIPELSEDREFPWPKPHFVNPTRSHLFEVSVFENDKAEFVIPEVLYSERLQALETALRGRGCVFEGLEVSLFYSEAENLEDPELNIYPATIEGIKEDDAYPDAHLLGSGFGTVLVDSQGYTDSFSPWEIIAENTAIERPRLSETDKKIISDGLNKQLRKHLIREHFSQPVNEVRYSNSSYISFAALESSLSSPLYFTQLSLMSLTSLDTLSFDV